MYVCSEGEPVLDYRLGHKTHCSYSSSHVWIRKNSGKISSFIQLFIINWKTILIPLLLATLTHYAVRIKDLKSLSLLVFACCIVCI